MKTVPPPSGKFGGNLGRIHMAMESQSHYRMALAVECAKERRKRMPLYEAYLEFSIKVAEREEARAIAVEKATLPYDSKAQAFDIETVSA